MPTETAVLEWAGQSFGGAVVGQLAGLGVQQVLLATGISHDPTAAILDALKVISQKLDLLMDAVKGVDARVAALSAQLNFSTLDVKASIQSDKLTAAIALIETHHAGPSNSPATPTSASSFLSASSGTPTFTSPIISLSDLIARRTHREPLTEDAMQAFMTNITVAWDIPRAVMSIHDGLLGDGDNHGLLRIWTDLSILQMGDGALDSRLLSFYDALEQRFLRAVTAQMQGMHLIMLSQCYGSVGNDIPDSAADYLSQSFGAGLLQQEIDEFLVCVERLGLSQGQWRSPWPITKEKMRQGADGKPELMAGIGVPADLGTILFRSEYLGRRLKETFRDMRNYPGTVDPRFGLPSPMLRSNGAYAHVLYRMSDSPTLTLWPANDADSRSYPSTGIPAVNWGRLTGGYLHLASKQYSGLQVARYFTPVFVPEFSPQVFPPQQPGSTFSISPAALTAMGIDSETHQYVVNGIAGSVEFPPVVAHGLDLSKLCTPPDPSNQATAWTVGAITGADRYSSGELATDFMKRAVISPDPDKPYQRGYAQLTGRQDFDSSGAIHGVAVRLESPAFSYRSVGERAADTLKVHAMLSMFSTRETSEFSDFHMSGRVTLTLATPTGDVALYDSDTENGGKMNLWNNGSRTGTIDPQVNDLVVITKLVQVGTWPDGAAQSTGEGDNRVILTKEQNFNLVMTLEVKHTGWHPHSACQISVSIEDFSLSWA
jgi:hypothetical protein